MSITTRTTGWMALVGLLITATFASSGVHAELVAGISDPGTPFFDNNFKLRANRGSWTVTGKGDFTFDNGTAYPGTGSSYKLTANFDKNDGTFLGGELTLKGAIPGLNIDNKQTVLLTATLDSYGYNSTFKDAAFGTVITGGEICVVIGCTTYESIHLFLDGAGLDGLLTQDRFKATGFAITTIPLPAALWLFGSGLVAMGTIARRRKFKAVV